MTASTTPAVMTSWSAAPALAIFRSAVRAVLADLERQGYFQVHLGYECVDAGFVPGNAGEDVETYSFYATGLSFWPISDRIDDLEEFELFTAIEFFHDHAAAPIQSSFHSYADCGIHVVRGDDGAGKMEFRERINPLLLRNGDGYELSGEGEVWTLTPANVPLDLGRLERDRCRNQVDHAGGRV